MRVRVRVTVRVRVRVRVRARARARARARVSVRVGVGVRVRVRVRVRVLQLLERLLELEGVDHAVAREAVEPVEHVAPEHDPALLLDVRADGGAQPAFERADHVDRARDAQLPG